MAAKQVKVLTSVILGVLMLFSPAYAVDIDVYWDSVTDATGYYVYYSEDSGVTWSAGTDASTSTNYTMTSMDEDKLLLFCVNAHYSNWGSIVECQTGAWYDHRESTSLDYAPTDVEFNWSTNGLSWTAVAEADGYKVYSKTGSGEWTLLRDVGSSTTYGISRTFGSLVLYRVSGYVGATEHIKYRSGVWTKWADTKPSRFRR